MSVMEMLIFPDMNRIKLDVAPEILFNMTLKVATRNIELCDLAAWIENYHHQNQILCNYPQLK